MRALLLAVALTSCHPQPPPTRRDAAAPPPAGSCSSDYKLTNADVCGRKFHGGTPCIQCPVAAPCFQPNGSVWCVPNCADDSCTFQGPDGQDGGVAAKPRKAAAPGVPCVKGPNGCTFKLPDPNR